MNFENQGVIKRLADQYGPENLAVILGNSETSGVEVFAETVTQGDPSYAGPLAGVSLKIPVYHVLEEDVMAVVPEMLSIAGMSERPRCVCTRVKRGGDCRRSEILRRALVVVVGV
jgi:hypothetical protein